MNIVEIFNVVALKDGWAGAARARRLALHDLEEVDGVIVRADVPRAYTVLGDYLANNRWRQDDVRRGKVVQADIDLFQDAVTPQQAHQIFKRLQSLRSLDFFNSEGCELRAHFMTAAIFDQRVVARRAWAMRAGKADNLYVDFDGGSRQRWQMHTAPVISVRLENGQCHDAVLDPGIFDGPATLQEWGAALHAKAGMVVVTDCFAEPVFAEGKTLKKGTSVDFYPVTPDMGAYFQAEKQALFADKEPALPRHRAKGWGL